MDVRIQAQLRKNKLWNKLEAQSIKKQLLIIGLVGIVIFGSYSLLLPGLIFVGIGLMPAIYLLTFAMLHLDPNDPIEPIKKKSEKELEYGQIFAEEYYPA